MDNRNTLLQVWRGVGQGMRWAGASFRGVGRNAARLLPLLLVTFWLMTVHWAIMQSLGLHHAGLRLATAFASDATVPAADAWLLVFGVFLTALQGACALAVGLALWAPDGTAWSWSAARSNARGRWVAVVGAGAVVTILWAVPEMLGVLAIANERFGLGSFLVLMGFVVLLYVAGRRYLAMPLALYEGMPAWRSFRESRPRLKGKRRSVAIAVFLVGLPTTLLVLVLKSPLASLQAGLAPWPALEAGADVAINAVVAATHTAFLSRLAWEVYRDLTHPSDLPPPVSLPGRAVAAARLAWLNRRDY